MRLTRKFLTAAGALSVAGVVGLGFASPAFADTATWPISYHTNPGLVQVGTATVIRNGNHVEVQISLNSGDSFAGTSNDLQICASTAAFTARVDGTSGCAGVPNGQFQQYTETGQTADVQFDLGSAFNGGPAYLQIHLNTIDNGVANTSMVNAPNDNQPIYGNVPTDPLPVAAIGAVGLAGGLGGVLFFMQRRRSKANAVA